MVDARPQLADLARELDELTWSKTLKFCVQLGMKYSVLDKIGEDKQGDLRLHAAMHAWLESDINASWKTVVTALKAIRMEVLAQELAEKYCKSCKNNGSSAATVAGEASGSSANTHNPPSSPPAPQVRLPARPSEWSSRDTRRYRQGYPSKRHYEDSSLTDNYRFYTNEIPYRPHGIRIEEFHKEMWGNYRELEYNHSYIQWLFPIREQGMNRDGQELQLHERMAITKDQKATERLKRSYKLMLDFYGIEEANGDGTQLRRSGNWKERFKNLNRSSHNYLRITHILKCLGEFGMETQKVCLVEFLLREAIVTGELRNVLDSCMCYWVEVLRDDGERERMWRMAQDMVDEVNAKDMERRAVATKHTAKVAPVTRASGYNQQGMGARAATTATGPQDTPPGENKVGSTGRQLGAGRETREVGAVGRDDDDDHSSGLEDPYHI